MTAVVNESDSGVFIIPKRPTDTGRLKESRRKAQAGHLAATMTQAYSRAELAQLCFDMGVDYESLGGDEKRGKIQALVGHFYRRKTMDVFIGFLEGDRPKWVWRLNPDSEQE
jgi:hypothetical protein